MKLLVVVLAVLAVASAADNVFQFPALKGYNTYSGLRSAVQPVYAAQTYAAQPFYAAQPLYSGQVYQKSLLAQPVYSPNVYSKYLQQPALVHSVPTSTYSSSVFEKVHHHHAPAVYHSAPVVVAPHYVEKYEKFQHHAPISHVFAQPALTSYSAVQRQAALPSVYASSYAGPQFRILDQTQEIDPLGAYHFSYATENGIQSTEQAIVKGAGPEGPVSAKEGAYSYTGPDGVVYTVNWVADENGYRASGAHLPQVPEEIKRSLEFNAQHPQVEDALKK